MTIGLEEVAASAVAVRLLEVIWMGPDTCKGALLFEVELKHGSGQETVEMDFNSVRAVVEQVQPP